MSTQDFMKKLGRNKEDQWRNSEVGRAEIDGVANMDATSAALVRGVQNTLGQGAGDAARFLVQAPGMLVNGLVGGAYDANAGAYQFVGDIGEALGAKGNWAQKQAAYNVQQSQDLQSRGLGNFQTGVGRDFGHGAVSAGATAPLTVAALLSRNPNAMTVGGGVQTGLTTYAQDRQNGYNPAQAMQSALIQGSIESLGEKLSSDALMDVAKMGVGRNMSRVGNYGIKEVGSEVLTGLSQDAARTAQYENHEQGWQGFQSRIGDTAQSSAIGALVQGGVNLGLVPTVNAARDIGQSFNRPSSSKDFADRLDSANLQQPAPNAAQPQPQAYQTPPQQPAVSSVLAQNILNQGAGNSVFKTRNDIPTVQQVTGQQQRPVQAQPMQQPKQTHNINAKNLTRNDLQQLAQNQNVRKMLDLIANAEGVKHGYNTLFGNERIGSLAAHPNISKEFKQTDGKTNRTTAAGRYQFLNSTWSNVAKRYGFTDFSGPNQDMGAIALIAGRGALNDVLNGNWESAVKKLGGEWASLPSSTYAQGKRSWDFINKHLGSNIQPSAFGADGQVQYDDNGQPIQTPMGDTSMFNDDGSDAAYSAARAQREAAEEQADAYRKIGKQTTVKIGSDKIDADLMLVDAMELSPSVAGTENQFRDRNRAASQIQVNEIANNLDPEILGDSKVIDFGAPTLAADGRTIIGGNGRTMGILKAYEQGNGEAYKSHLANTAAELGLDAADVLAMNQPVLVRRLRNPDVDIAKASIASNENSGLAMSALEQARVDSGRLPSFGQLQMSEDGNLNTPSNRGFIRDFVAQMPTTMQATMVDAQGNLSQDGLRRMQNAILHRAYGESQSLSRMVESTDQGARNLIAAMTKSAPRIAAAKDAIAQQGMHDADISNDLIAAVETINQLRSDGRSVEDYLAQQGMFADDLAPVVKELVAFLDANIRSAKKISELIEAYYDALAEQGSPNQDDIFGDNTPPTKEQVYATAKQQFDKQHTAPEQNDIFTQPATGTTEQQQPAEPVADGQQQSESSGSNGQSAEQGARLDNNVLESLRNFTANLFAKNPENQKRKTFKSALQIYQNAQGQQVYDLLLQTLYMDLRSANYADTSNGLFDHSIGAHTAKTNANTKEVRHQGGWHYRMPQSYSNFKTSHRISLNVWGNLQLTDALDALANQYGFYYKTPDSSAGWQERHDPITIYMPDSISGNVLSEVQEAVKALTKPYIRSNDGFGSYGQELAKGVEYGQEPDANTIASLKHEAGKRSPEFEKAVSDYVGESNKLSAGQAAAIQKALDLFDKFQSAQQNPVAEKVQQNESANNAKSDSYSRSNGNNIGAIESAIQDALGSLSQHVDVVSAFDVFPREQAQDYIDGNAEGAYSPNSRNIVILAESVTPERAVWVAWHELGHRGFDTPYFKEYKSLVKQARNNPTINKLSKAIMKDRKQYADDPAGQDIDAATEEAIVELYAAVKTQDHDAIERRYGVAMPQAMRGDLETALDRLIAKFKALMAKVVKGGKTFTDQDVMDLLAGVEMAASDANVGGSDGIETKLSRAKENIVDFVGRVIEDKTLREQMNILEVTATEADIAQENGLDISNYSHMIDSSAVNHILKNHGNELKEKQRGQIAISASDFELIPDVISNPDKTIFGTKNNVGRDQIVYLKKMQDGSLLMIEEQRTGRRKLALHTMRKYPATTDDSSIVKTLLSNAQSDSGNNLSIVNHLENDNKNNGIVFSRNDAPTDLDDWKQSVTEMGGNVSAHESGDIITLNKIVFAPDARNSGLGTQAMQSLVAYADTNKKHIALTPSSDFGGNAGRLKQFYKRFGFIENKGKNKVYQTSETMYREAKGGATLFSRGDSKQAEAKKFVEDLLEKALEREAFFIQTKGSLEAYAEKSSIGAVIVENLKTSMAAAQESIRTGDYINNPNYQAHIKQQELIAEDNAKRTKIEPQKEIEQAQAPQAQPPVEIKKSKPKADTKMVVDDGLDNKQIDAEYKALVERYQNGDESAEQPLRELVNRVAEARGFNDDASFRMDHKAPTNNDSSTPAYDVSESFGDDVYDRKVAAEYYGHGDSAMDMESLRQIWAMKNNPDVEVEIYRAIRKDVQGTGIGNGDWVTLSRKYAVEHGKTHLDGNYKIVKKTVPAKHLFTDGNSIHEFGYDSGRTELRSQTADRTKLADLITYDDKGKVIPLSKRFNAKSKDIRFSRQQQKQWANEVGELNAGVAAYQWLSEHLTPTLARIGFARSTPAFGKYMREYRAMLNASGMTAQEMAESMKVLSESDRKLLSDVIELEVPAGVAVPQEIQDVATAIRTVFNQQSDDLVALQMLSPDAADRWRDTYLPRIYDKHADMFSDLAKAQAQMRGQMRTGMGNAIKGNHLKGRGIFKLVPPKEQAYWESKGFEVRENQKGKVLMWRDYTRQEREQMNENRDAGLRFATGFIKTQSDIAKGMLFKRIAQDDTLASTTQLEPNWVHVPDTPIAGTGGVKRYGALSGMYVHPEVMADLQRSFFLDNAAAKVWLKALAWWKVTKTVYNPVAHVNNVISNMVMYWMAGGKTKDLHAGLRSMIQKDTLYREALEQGIIGDNVDVAGIKEMFTGLNTMSDESAMDNILQRALKRIDKLTFNATSKTGQFAQDAYQAEDVVFKLGLYKKGRDLGLSPSEAADYAISFMFDYTELPKSVRALRDLGILPFVSYTYKAVPAMARLALTRPHRVAAVSAAMYGFNAMSYLLLNMLGHAADEEEERKYMPDYQKGSSVFGMPKLLRLPVNDANGDPLFIDVYRWLPLGDFADVNNQMSGMPLPNWAMPNGPMFNHYAALVMNKDTFTGRELVNDRMDAGEKTNIYGKWMASQWMPASVGVPFSYHTNNVLNGMSAQFKDTPVSDVLEHMGYTGQNYRGEDVKLNRAVMGSLGVKVRGQPVDQMRESAMRKRKYELQMLRSDIARIRNDKTSTEANRKAKIEARQEQIKRLLEQ